MALGINFYSSLRPELKRLNRIFQHYLLVAPLIIEKLLALVELLRFRFLAHSCQLVLDEGLPFLILDYSVHQVLDVVYIIQPNRFVLVVCLVRLDCSDFKEVPGDLHFVLVLVEKLKQFDYLLVLRVLDFEVHLMQLHVDLILGDFVVMVVGLDYLRHSVEAEYVLARFGEAETCLVLSRRLLI